MCFGCFGSHDACFAFLTTLQIEALKRRAESVEKQTAFDGAMPGAMIPQSELDQLHGRLSTGVAATQRRALRLSKMKATFEDLWEKCDQHPLARRLDMSRASLA